MKTVVVKKFDNPAEAHIIAEFLRSEGIECEVLENDPFSSLMPGSSQLIVLEDQQEKAKALLEQN